MNSQSAKAGIHSDEESRKERNIQKKFCSVRIRHVISYIQVTITLRVTANYFMEAIIFQVD